MLETCRVSARIFVVVNLGLAAIVVLREERIMNVKKRNCID